MFYASSGIAVLSVAALYGLKETLPQKRRFTLADLKVRWRDVWYPPSIAPAFVLFLLYTGYGLLLTVSPDHSDALGLENRGLYFLFFTGGQPAEPPGGRAGVRSVRP